MPSTISGAQRSRRSPRRAGDPARQEADDETGEDGIEDEHERMVEDGSRPSEDP